jgi:hypothetical protein
MESIPSGAGANRYVNENLHVKEIYTEKFLDPDPTYFEVRRLGG